MKNKRLALVARRICIPVIFILLLMATCPAQAAPAKVYQWKMYHYMSLAVSGVDKVLEEWRAEVKKATRGTLVINRFNPGEHPFKGGADILKAMQDRSCEIADFYPGYFSGTEASPIVMSLPLLMPTNFEAILKIYKDLKGEIFEPTYGKYGGTIAATWWFPFHSIGTPVPLTGWDSFKGLKIRATGLENAQLLKMLGAVPVSMPFSDVPSALMTGAVDGVQVSSDAYWGAKLAESGKIKYVNLLEIACMPTSIVVNRKALAELPADTRKIFMDLTAKYEHAMNLANWLSDNVGLRMIVIHYGVTLVSPPREFRKELVAKARTQIWQPWAERAGAPGKAALETVLKKLKSMGY